MTGIIEWQQEVEGEVDLRHAKKIWIMERWGGSGGWERIHGMEW